MLGVPVFVHIFHTDFLKRKESNQNYKKPGLKTTLTLTQPEKKEKPLFIIIALNEKEHYCDGHKKMNNVFNGYQYNKRQPQYMPQQVK